MREPREPSNFCRRVVAVVRRIPGGKVASYGEVAAAAGRPRAARAVGNILASSAVRGAPCHRVIAAQGRLGGFGGNLPLKRSLLAQEGIKVRGDRVLDWRSHRWAIPRPAAGRKSATGRERG